MEVERRQIGELDQVALKVAVDPDLVLPTTGEVIDLRDPAQVAHGLDSVRYLVRQLGELRKLLETVLRLEGQRQGTKTLHLHGFKAEISGGETVEWNISALRGALEAAGLPDERMRELIKAEVVYKVNASVAKQLASANPEYAKAIDHAKSMVPAAWRVSVKPE
jgi:hypothetical protein